MLTDTFTLYRPKRCPAAVDTDALHGGLPRPWPREKLGVKSFDGSSCQSDMNTGSPYFTFKNPTLDVSSIFGTATSQQHHSIFIIDANFKKSNMMALENI